MHERAELSGGVRRRARPHAAAPPRGLSRQGLSPSSILALQRTAGNRATAQLLQRAIIAIDGDNDGEASKAATRACLWNLANMKDSKQTKDVRGRVAGPTTANGFEANLRPILGSDDETIYVLAHGSRYSHSIADMEPRAMAAWLRAHFSYRAKWGPLGWLGFTAKVDRPFTGTIKLVSCHSAADKGNRTRADYEVSKEDWQRPYLFDRSYAQVLAQELAPTAADDPFQPASVQGIVGIGWVDELSGAITAIDKNLYDAKTANMGQNTDVGSAQNVGKDPNPFAQESSPAKRGTAIRALFGDPVEVTVVPQSRGNLSGMRIGKGEWGKRSFAVGSGTEIIKPTVDQLD